MKHREIEIHDYEEFQERFRQELENIEDIIPEQIIETEERLLKNTELNSLGLIAGGIAMLAGVLLGSFWLSAAGLTLSAWLAMKLSGKFQSLKKLRQKATATLTYLKGKVQNAWRFLTGKKSSQKRVSLSSSMRKVKKQSKGVIFGTLAKLADEEGISVGLLRFAFILGGIISGFFPVFIGYIVLSIAKNSKNTSSRSHRKSSYKKKRYTKTVTYSYKNKPKKFSKYERWEYWDF